MNKETCDVIIYNNVDIDKVWWMKFDNKSTAHIFALLCRTVYEISSSSNKVKVVISNNNHLYPNRRLVKLRESYVKEVISFLAPYIVGIEDIML